MQIHTVIIILAIPLKIRKEFIYIEKDLITQMNPND